MNKVVHPLYCAILLLACSANPVRAMTPFTDASATAGDSTILKTTPLAPLLAGFDNHRLSFDWFSAKASVEYQDTSQELSGTLNLRMKSDSLIWMNLTKLGFEVARILIRPDSVFFVNRIEGTYSAQSLAEFGRRFNFPASFPFVQELLTGNFLTLPDADSTAVDSSATGLLTHQLSPGFRCSQELDLQSLELRRTVLLSPEGGTLAATAGEYGLTEGASGQKFSYFRHFNINSAATGNVSLEIRFSKAEVGAPKSLRFEIPAHYQRMD